MLLYIYKYKREGGVQMYRAIDIALYVVNYINNCGRTVSNLKLQKILYYIQAAFLCEISTECFLDPILHWRHGPVILSVYDNFNKFGASNIPSQNTVTRIMSENGRLKLVNINFDEEIINRQHRNIINAVVNGLMDYGAWYLVDRTHEETPWLSGNPDEEITSQSIRDYFINHRRRYYGNFDN